MLMEEFSTHPSIAVANSYPFEVKLASYYGAAWNVLTSANYSPTRSETDFAAFATRDEFIGRNPWNRPALLDAVGTHRATRLFQTVVPERLLALYRTTIEEFYTIIADETRPGEAIHLFAEKGVVEQPVRQAVRHMFGSVREIVMVRDPRDFLCSAQKFWHYDVQAAINAMRTEFPALLDIYRTQPAGTLFVRYEDLIQDPAPARQKVYDFLGCPPPPAADKSAQRSKVPESHRTSRSAAESIGRYKNELDAQTLDLCQQTFARFLQAFDYK
jgi:hypothetical protein